MAEINEFRAGAVSGVIAGLMVIALTAMAFVSFDAPAALDYSASPSQQPRSGDAQLTHFETDTNRPANPLSP